MSQNVGFMIFHIRIYCHRSVNFETNGIFTGCRTSNFKSRNVDFSIQLVLSFTPTSLDNIRKRFTTSIIVYSWTCARPPAIIKVLRRYDGRYKVQSSQLPKFRDENTNRGRRSAWKSFARASRCVKARELLVKFYLA